jgi:flavin-dependent dehydrogenase
MNNPSSLQLASGSRVAVIGGGPAGTLFSYFLLTMAERLGTEVSVDVYEPRNFSQTGPAGCNMCGGIVSESMVQLLATEGINLPSTVVQRGIDSYVLHMDIGTVRIDPPAEEKRIAAIHRGSGPKGTVEKKWLSFDGYLLGLTTEKGAAVVSARMEEIDWRGDKPRIRTRDGLSDEYDLVVGAVGVNSPALKLFAGMGKGYVPPKSTKTFICEFFLGKEIIEICLGNSMHVFLLNLPRLEFAAIIPKGDYVTVCLLGESIDAALVDAFLNAPEVRACFPPGWTVPQDYCRCSPGINIAGSPQPFADRLVFVGDCGVSRLYKDGIGGAYRTAKAAAKTALFHGVSAEDFRQHFFPTCKALANDNAIGKVIFMVTTLIRNVRFARRGVMRMTMCEQRGDGLSPRLSSVLWDTFTGSAPYRDVFTRTLSPLFLGRLFYDTAMGLVPVAAGKVRKEATTAMGELGKAYDSGEVIVRQGEAGDCMYVIQSGRVEVVRERDGKEVHFAELGTGDFFGEMALFEKHVRSATVRSLETSRILTIDKKIFLQKIHDDPSLAFRIMQKMSNRIRELNEGVMKAASV